MAHWTPGADKMTRHEVGIILGMVSECERCQMPVTDVSSILAARDDRSESREDSIEGLWERGFDCPTP